MFFGLGRVYKKVKRPSWLHPVKRVLWVHRYGPHRPHREVLIGDRVRTFGVIRDLS